MALSSNVKVSIKIVTIIFLILILWALSSAVYFTANDRESRLREVEREISSSWWESQFFWNLWLQVKNSITESTTENKKTTTKTRDINQILPIHDLVIHIEDNVQIKNRNMFSTPVYEMDITANWYIDPKDIEDKNKDLFLSAEDLSLLVSVWDVHGIINHEILLDNKLIESQATINEEQIYFQHDYKTSYRDSLSFSIDSLTTRNSQIPISYSFKMRGTKDLIIGSIPTNSEISMVSNWPHPSFQWRILPDESDITEEWFTANWKTPALSESWDFWVIYMLEVEIYQKIERSIKYAILFIVSTFFAFFIVEILQKQRVHPIQYMLIWISMLIFYLLLLSFAEHILFLYAYIIATWATISLISFYSFSILKNRYASIFITGLLLFLYVFLYIIINLEDNALMVWSIFCFLIISSIMIATRKIDWYNISQD
jgi:inner membrane protein